MNDSKKNSTFSSTNTPLKGGNHVKKERVALSEMNLGLLLLILTALSLLISVAIFIFLAEQAVTTSSQDNSVPHLHEIHPK